MRLTPTMLTILTLSLGATTSLPHAHAENPPCHQVSPDAAARSGKLTAHYDVPDVTLIDQDGRSVRLAEFLDADRPVFVNFIFATCTTVCPVLSAGFSKFQSSIEDPAARPRLASITIDPEHDTPQVLHAYAQRFSASDGWAFLTGSREDISAVMRAFDVYVSNKMDHKPITFERAPGAHEWSRIEGFMSVADYQREYAALASH